MSTISFLVWQFLHSYCVAQIGVDHQVLVASYQSELAKGHIWKDEHGALTLQLNGEVMSHTEDEHLYHELLVHPGILTAKTMRRVLIIGGAEGATAREVLRHKHVESITMVDIDKDLVNMCRTHLNTMHRGSFDSPKMNISYEDGAAYIRTVLPASFDVVLIDGIDFGSYGNSLFAQDFYEHVHRSLAPGGTVAQYMSDVNRSEEMSLAGFKDMLNYGVDIWTYPGWGARFQVASKDSGGRLKDQLFKHLRLELPNLNLSYLTEERMMQALNHKGRRLKGGGGVAGGGGPGGSGGWSWWSICLAVLGLGCLVACVIRKKKKKESEESEAAATTQEEKNGKQSLLDTVETQEDDTMFETRLDTAPEDAGAGCCSCSRSRR